MATRSRKGCIDCKQAKVKCDEVHPSCGTCARRGRQCRGYNPLQIISSSTSHSGSTRHRNRHAISHGQRQRRASQSTTTSDTSTSLDDAEDRPYLSWPPVTDALGRFGDTSMKSPSEDDTCAEDAWLSLTSQTTAADYMSAMVLEASAKSQSVPKSPSLVPLSEILAADKPFIEVYFMRHPSDLVMSDEFVSEMNAFALALLQQSPTAVCDSLSAIGENYIKDPSAIQMSNRKMRLVSRLRMINEDGSSLELVLALLLGLCGVELIDPRSNGKGSMLPALVDNMAMILEFHMRSGREVNDSAKYYARGIARQDLLISLSRMQRTKIHHSTWLDDYSRNHADRFMGFTTTLAPILSDLCALAEDVEPMRDAFSNMRGNTLGFGSDVLEFGALDNGNENYSKLAERENRIRAQLVAWRPIHDSTMSMQTSHKFLLHAYAWRAAGLLYLFRLFNPPGSSPDADQMALSMAYEIMVHVSGHAEAIKLSLWPLFVAACDLQSEEDRSNARDLFDKICRARPIVTAKRTKWFCEEVVWPARDRDEDWDWMRLARLDDNAFVPL